MNRKVPITTSEAPEAIGPYSQGISAHGFLFVSGQLPITPGSGHMINTDIASRAEQVFENLSAIIQAAGGSLDDVVKITLFLTDMADFPQVNEVYSKFFHAPYPARSTIQVAALPLGSDIEAEAIVYLP